MRRLTTVPRPATGKTPVRNFRAPDELWDVATRIAAHRGETMTDVLLKAVEAYVKRHRKELPPSGQGDSTPPATT